jgi:hypothetical protein
MYDGERAKDDEEGENGGMAKIMLTSGCVLYVGSLLPSFCLPSAFLLSSFAFTDLPSLVSSFAYDL